MGSLCTATVWSQKWAHYWQIHNVCAHNIKINVCIMTMRMCDLHIHLLIVTCLILKEGKQCKTKTMTSTQIILNCIPEQSLSIVWLGRKSLKHSHTLKQSSQSKKLKERFTQHYKCVIKIWESIFNFLVNTHLLRCGLVSMATPVRACPASRFDRFSWWWLIITTWLVVPVSTNIWHELPSAIYLPKCSLFW